MAARENSSLKILLKCPNGERRTINIAASASLKVAVIDDLVLLKKKDFPAFLAKNDMLENLWKATISIQISTMEKSLTEDTWKIFINDTC